MDKTLEAEKKLVAEWMGWGCTLGTEDKSWDAKGIVILSEEWNPQSERKWWDEIWGKMNWVEVEATVKTLILWANENRHHPTVPEVKYDETTICWKMLTTKPSVCWKALIKTLEEL